MKVVLDTNVVMSGLCFGGIPGKVLEAWSEGRIHIVISAAILAEYREVGHEMSLDHPALDFESFAALLVLTRTSLMHRNTCPSRFALTPMTTSSFLVLPFPGVASL